MDISVEYLMLSERLFIFAMYTLFYYEAKRQNLTCWSDGHNWICIEGAFGMHSHFIRNGRRDVDCQAPAHDRAIGCSGAEVIIRRPGACA